MRLRSVSRWRRDLALPQQATLFMRCCSGRSSCCLQPSSAQAGATRYLLFIQSYWLLLGAADRRHHVFSA
jgi:hypothetical protein